MRPQASNQVCGSSSRARPTSGNPGKVRQGSSWSPQRRKNQTDWHLGRPWGRGERALYPRRTNPCPVRWGKGESQLSPSRPIPHPGKDRAAPPLLGTECLLGQAQAPDPARRGLAGHLVVGQGWRALGSFTLQNLETLCEWVLLFSWQYACLHKFNKNSFFF